VYKRQSVFGAVVFGLVYPDGPGLIGGFPGVYGLIGGFTCLIWLYLNATGQNQLQAFTMIGILMALQLVFGALYGANPMWVADLAGFVAGFALSFVLLPGAMGQLRKKLRAR